jgi:carbonic anhydrase
LLKIIIALIGKDPQKWEEHESNCGGHHQSPININTEEVIVTNYPKLIFQNYDLTFPESLEDNGNTGTIKFIILFISIAVKNGVSLLVNLEQSS